MWATKIRQVVEICRGTMEECKGRMRLYCRTMQYCTVLYKGETLQYCTADVYCTVLYSTVYCIQLMGGRVDG